MTSCLSLRLLGSDPHNLQPEVPCPRLSESGGEKRSSSSMSVRSSIVGTPPPRNSIKVPKYRRFEDYDSKIDNVLVGINETQMMDTATSSMRTPRVRSAGVGKPKEESEKAKGKKRCSVPGPSHCSLIYVTTNECPIDDDHVAPFRPKNVTRPSPTSFAGPSGSGSSSSAHMLRRESMTPPITQLQKVEEHKELSSPCSSASSIATMSPLACAATITEDSNPGTPSPRLTKRVSFSDAASSIVIAPSSPLSPLATTGPTRSSWSGFFRPVVSRAPPVKQVYVPPARGQAAGRSILKRTSSYSDAGKREFTDLPMDEKIESTSLATGKSKTAKADHVETLHEEFVDVDLTEGRSVRSSSTTITVAARPELVRSRPSYEQRAVRQWSVMSSNWVRRSGLFAQEVEMKV